MVLFDGEKVTVEQGNSYEKVLMPRGKECLNCNECKNIGMQCRRYNSMLELIHRKHLNVNDIIVNFGLLIIIYLYIKLINIINLDFK